jgi:hypothetical protein
MDGARGFVGRAKHAGMIAKGAFAGKEKSRDGKGQDLDTRFVDAI